jgi:CheY-like chemotaxis protein
VRERRSSLNPANVAGLRVLVAEDNLINQEVTLGILADLGCTAICVADGSQALEALERDAFDIVLMDCQMPVMDGYETTRAWRQREAATGRHQKVIALTANASSEDREACRVAGMDDFLSKPFQRSELCAMLAKHVGTIPPEVATAEVAPAVVAPAVVAPAVVAPAVVAPVVVAPVKPTPVVEAQPDVLDPSTLAQIRATQRPGRPDLVARILTLFLEKSPAQLSEICEAASDPARLARAAHSLKGGSANLGLVQLASLLSSIEQHAKRNQLTEIPTLLEALPGAHAAAMQAVRHELAPKESHV